MENPETKSDLGVLPLQGDRKPTPFLRTEFNESSGQFSPDGHWIAYTSDESGGDEIYVREFSSGSAQGSWDAAGKWLISKGGGTEPRWREDGKELFYVASDGKLMSIEISAKPVFQAGVPRLLFQMPLASIGAEVTADGRRFLIGVSWGAKCFRTLYGSAELAEHLEEMSHAILRRVRRRSCGGTVSPFQSRPE